MRVSRILLIITGLFLGSVINAQTCEDSKINIDTYYGRIVVRLYNETPLHRNNFIELVKSGFYDNCLFHRVINNFMIQGGDPNSKNSDKGEMLGMGGPGYTIPAEIDSRFYHKKGAIAAARQGDAVNPLKASSGSQFYIVQGQVYSNAQINAFISMGKVFTEQQIKDYTTIGGTPHLDGEYTVFGEITEGFDVLDKIAALPVDAYNRPLQDVIYTMTIK